MEPAEVLKEFSVKLLELPVRDPTFIEILRQHDLLPGDREDRMAEGTEKKGAQFLKNEISKSVGITRTSYDNLILAMKKFNSPTTAALAKQMEKASGISPAPDPLPNPPKPSQELPVSRSFKDLSIDDKVNVDELWSVQNLKDEFRKTKRKVPLMEEDEKKVLDEVVLLLLTVNENETLAARCYLEPLDGHDNIYEHSQRVHFGGQLDSAAIYYIGKFGACPAAIRRIPAGGKVQGGAIDVPKLAFQSFPNLGAIIAVGVACGVEKKVKMCDILVSTQVISYQEARVQDGGFQNRGQKIDAAPYLVSLFNDIDVTVLWPNDSIRKRIEKSNMPIPEVKEGKILSGPYLIDDSNFKKMIIQSIDIEAKGIEMEGAYLFEALQHTQAKAIIVKAVCDFGDGQKNKKYQPTAALLAADFVYEILNNPNVPKMIVHNK